MSSCIFFREGAASRFLYLIPVNEAHKLALLDPIDSDGGGQGEQAAFVGSGRILAELRNLVYSLLGLCATQKVI